MTGRETAAAGAPGGGIRATDDGAGWIASGALTFANAGPVLAQARALPLPASGVVDLSGLGAVDSATVAVLLAVKRLAQAAGRDLVFAGAPGSLVSLASLYGVEEILGA
jgi:phospholipid transport system transporter-binding protein